MRRHHAFSATCFFCQFNGGRSVDFAEIFRNYKYYLKKHNFNFGKHFPRAATRSYKCHTTTYDQMDYIPQPLVLRTPGHQIAVPLLSHTRYDKSIPFAKYPETQGWGRKSIAEWFKVFQSPTSEFQAFLQRWLLFAPLQAFGGHQLGDFPSGAEMNEVSLRMLPQLAEQWLRIGPGEIDIEILNTSRHFEDLLRASQSMIRILSTPDSDTDGVLDMEDTKLYTLSEFARMPGHGDPCHPEVSIAISSMLTFIRASQLDALMKSAGNFVSDNARLGHTEVYQGRSPIWRRLLNQGWCPFQLTPMSARFNTAGLAFMSLVKEPGHPGVRKTDAEADQPAATPDKADTITKNGQPCSSFNCVYRLLNDDTYTRRHVCHKSCSDVLVREEEMRTIFFHQPTPSFPLIVSIDEDDTNPELQLVPWRSGVPFVAISHVWSDGLGNPKKNAIPRCQLRRLSKYAREILKDTTDPPLFWLDTICVPPDEICKNLKSDEREMQNLAMRQMKNTYEQSTVTLVLDNWLLSTKIANMTDAEKMMRIFTCAWNSRLWTYQEGALPRSLYFQFEDTAEDIDKMKQQLEIDMKSDVALRYTLGERLLAQYNSLRGFQAFDKDSEDFVLFVLGNMAYRSTSVASDEALCLSTLMGLQTGAKASTEEQTSDPEGPMAEFWRQVPYAPSSLLLASVPTLNKTGLSWAPCSTLLNEYRLSETGSLNTIPNISLRRPTTLTTRGLEIQSPGLLIRCEGFRPEGRVFVRDDLKFGYEIMIYLYSKPEVDIGAFKEAVGVLVVTSHNRVDECIEEDGVLQPLLLMRPPYSDGTMAGRKIGMAIIRRMTPQWDKQNLEWLAKEDRLRDGIVGDVTTRKLHFAEGRNVLSERWCVG